MIVVAGKIPIRADKRDEAVAAAELMAAKTNEEEGCISYGFFFSISDLRCV